MGVGFGGRGVASGFSFLLYHGVKTISRHRCDEARTVLGAGGGSS